MILTNSSGQTALDRVYKDPMTNYALDLSEWFLKRQKIDRTTLAHYFRSLPTGAEGEFAKIETLIAGHANGIAPNLSTRSGQLAWAAGLAYLHMNTPPPGSVRQHPMWKILTQHPLLSDTLTTAARFIDTAAITRNTTMDWGTPGSWFWFVQKRNHINIDLFHTLLGGFQNNPATGAPGLANAIHLMLHEVGHSQLTLRFTDAMLALKAREVKLRETNALRPLTPDEFEDLTRIREEFILRLNFFNAVEDNCVNTYALRKGKNLPFDIKEATNVTGVLLNFGPVIRAVERNAIPAKAAAQHSLDKLNHVTSLAFYTHNGFFSLSDQTTWARLGIDPGKLVGDLDHFMRINVGAKGIANLQPVSRDNWLLRHVFASNVKSHAERRCEIIDELWDDYAAAHAKILIEAAVEQTKKAMEEKKADPKKSKGKKGKRGKSGGESNDDEQEGGGASAKKNYDQNKSGTGQTDQPPPDKQDVKQQDSKPEPAKDPNTMNVEGVGEMKAGNKPLPATPEDARKSGQKSGADDASGEKPKTVHDLAQESRQKEGKGAEDDKNAHAQGSGPGGDVGFSPKNLKPAPGILGKGLDLATLSAGNWHDFAKRIGELEPIIVPVERSLHKIIERQTREMTALSKEKERFPRGSDFMKRLDLKAHLNFAIKRNTGQHLEIADHQRFFKDEIIARASKPKIWILGDGSGSMQFPLPGGGRRIDSALQSMAVFYETGRRLNIDTFVGIWGDKRISMLAAPGFTYEQIGVNFQKAKDGIDCSTYLSPSLNELVNISSARGMPAQRKVSQGDDHQFCGMTHILIISDGALQAEDREATFKMFLNLLRHGPGVTVDIAVVGDADDRDMDDLVDRIKEDFPQAPLSILRANNSNDIPILLAEQIEHRFEQSATDFMAMRDSARREAFARVQRAFQYDQI